MQHDQVPSSRGDANGVDARLRSEDSCEGRSCTCHASHCSTAGCSVTFTIGLFNQGTFLSLIADLTGALPPGLYVLWREIRQNIMVEEPLCHLTRCKSQGYGTREAVSTDWTLVRLCREPVRHAIVAKHVSASIDSIRVDKDIRADDASKFIL